MKKLLIVVDMQNDFITGALGSPQAVNIVPGVKAKINEYKQNGDDIIFTRDTHNAGYPETREGKYLPAAHCIEGTEGHLISSGLDTDCSEIIDKPNFGSLDLAEKAAAGGYDNIELCGLCTDICVVSNALILRARLSEANISVDARLCAGVTEESHNAALLTMRMCHINIIDGDTQVE